MNKGEQKSAFDEGMLNAQIFAVKKVMDDASNLAIDNAIHIVQSHLPDPQNASGVCVSAITYELNEIISKLEKLKG
jgi:hypothetical protein